MVDYILDTNEYTEWEKYSEDEWTEFIHVWKHLKSWLNVDICLDDDEYYITNNHPLWIYFKNCYDDRDEWVPLVITKQGCYIPLLNIELNITYLDYKQVCNFGKIFYTFIKQLADGKINYSYFVNAVNNIYSLANEYPNVLEESSDFSLLEMDKLIKDESGLPRDLYIDDAQTYIKGKHGPRIKFQSPKNIKDKRSWPSITFSNKINDNSDISELKCIGNKEDIDLDNKSINHIKYFVRANVPLLLQVANKEVDFDYFRHYFKTVDINGNIIKDPSKKEYVIYKSANCGFNIIKHQNGKFNYIKNNELLSNEWFDLADIFVKHDNDYKAFIRNNDNMGFINTNGKIEYIS